MPFRAHALVITAPRTAVLQEEEVAEPGPGQATVRAIATLVSTGTEMTAFSGEFPRRPSAWSRWVRYPFRAGYSHVGEVIAVGPQVEGLRPGQRVFSGAPHVSVATLSAGRLTPIPEGVGVDEATFLNIACIALNGVRLGEVAIGEATVVAGMGVVGAMALQYAHLAGAFPLIAVDVADNRLAGADRLGATVAVNPGREDLAAILERLTRGRKADVVFEVTGNPEVIPSLPPLLRRGGRLVLLGSPRGPSTIDLHDEVHTLGLRLIGAHISTHPPVETPASPWTWQRNAALFLDLLRAGRIDVRGLITHRYPWSEAPAVFRRLLDDRSLTRGVILDWQAAGEPGGSGAGSGPVVGEAEPGRPAPLPHAVG